MRDLLAHAEPQQDGTYVVPPTAPFNSTSGTIEIKPYVRPMHREPHPIIVIPKRMLDEPMPSAPKKIALFDRPGAKNS